MTLDEIKKKYIKTCGKANGDPSVCSHCKNPCAEGKRAIQLLANQVYNDPPVPLYGGKTMIEMAKEENMRRRREKEQKEKEQMKEVKHRPNFNAPDDWWEQSLKSGNQVKWLMDNLGISKTQANKKIYSYRYRNGLTNKRDETLVMPVTKPAEAPKIEVKQEDNRFENKLDRLMKEQEDFKKIMDQRYADYVKAKEIYESISKKVDILCSAMDILSE